MSTALRRPRAAASRAILSAAGSANRLRRVARRSAMEGSSSPKQETGASLEAAGQAAGRRAGHQWWRPLVLAQTSSPAAKVWGSSGSPRRQGSGASWCCRLGLLRLSSKTGEWGELVLPSPLPPGRRMHKNHEDLGGQARRDEPEEGHTSADLWRGCVR